jgi:hypothetical protein
MSDENIDKIEIRELDLNLIRPTFKDIRDKVPKRGFKLVIIGKPGTGKSTIIASILHHKRSLIPTGVIMSGTEDSNQFYQTIFPNTFIYNKYSTDVTKNFVHRQKIATKYLPNPWGVLLLDDCTDDPRIFKSVLINHIYKNGRHSQFLFIVSLQYCMDVMPNIRTNIDGVFILRETNLKNRKSLYENYAGVIPDFRLFCDIMDSLTADYCALYIDNTSTSTNYLDCIYWYKVKNVAEVENFRFGSPNMWTYHQENYDTSYNDMDYL